MLKKAPRTAHRIPKDKQGKASNQNASRKSDTLVVNKNTAAAAMSPAPVQASIRLPLSNATPAEVMGMTLKIRDGMTDNLYYEELVAIQAALAASYTGQRSLADQVTSLQAQLKTTLAAQAIETANGRDVLKSAAHGCESVNSTDEALTSVGWDLKRGRSPSQILPPPSRLTLRSSGFPGQMIARWGKVTNFRFYEYQMAVPENILTNPDWETVVIKSTSAGSEILPKATVGKEMHMRVRTVSAKGPSPWTDAVVAIVL